MPKIVKEQELRCWLDSKDQFLVDLANFYIGKELQVDFDLKEEIGRNVKDQPVYTIFNGEKDLIQLLDFFSTFAIGAAEMKDQELKAIYDRRVVLFIHGLSKMGYSRSKGDDTLGSLEKIVRIGTGRSVYRMLELKRFSDVKK